MSIANYTELQTAVGNWCHRAGLDAVIPDLITLGEATINRKLRLTSMQSEASFSTSTSDRFADLPTGFIELIDIALYVDNEPSTLTQLPLSKINNFSLTSPQLPRFYAISNNIIFDTKSDQVYTGSIRYFKRLDIATDTTNDVLTNHPDIYLYSALMTQAPYVKDTNMLNIWVELLKDAYKSANKQDGRNRSKAMLTISAGLRSSDNSNIITGQ